MGGCFICVFLNAFDVSCDYIYGFNVVFDSDSGVTSDYPLFYMVYVDAPHCLRIYLWILILCLKVVYT